MKISDIYCRVFRSEKLKKSHRKLRHKAPHIIKHKTKNPDLVKNIPDILNTMPATEVIFLADLVDTYELLAGMHGQELLAETLHKRLAAQHAEYTQLKG